MTVVVRSAWHHVDVGTLPLAAEYDNSGRWISGGAWFYLPESKHAHKKTQCIFKESEHEQAI